MQGLKAFVLLAVVVTLGLASAAPAENEAAGVEQLPATAGPEKPAMLVRAGLGEPKPAARRCTNSSCRPLCRALGWNHGVCLTQSGGPSWCWCYN